MTITRTDQATVLVRGGRRVVALNASRGQRLRHHIHTLTAAQLRSGYQVSRGSHTNRLSIFVRGQSYEMSAFPGAALGEDAEKRFPPVDPHIARMFRFLRVLAEHLVRQAAIPG